MSAIVDPRYVKDPKRSGIARMALVVTKPRACVDVWLGDRLPVTLEIPDCIERSLIPTAYYSEEFRGDQAWEIAGAYRVELSVKVF